MSFLFLFKITDVTHTTTLKVIFTTETQEHRAIDQKGHTNALLYDEQGGMTNRQIGFIYAFLYRCICQWHATETSEAVLFIPIHSRMIRGEKRF